ncbi:hypothetical protein SynA1524_00555 [Synechococcus sp. A15-24]|nr:hypothetical protein SynA1524_00555 [Synechococcus sp. A15-24]
MTDQWALIDPFHQAPPACAQLFHRGLLLMRLREWGCGKGRFVGRTG